MAKLVYRAFYIGAVVTALCLGALLGLMFDGIGNPLAEFATVCVTVFVVKLLAIETEDFKKIVQYLETLLTLAR